MLKWKENKTENFEAEILVPALLVAKSTSCKLLNSWNQVLQLANGNSNLSQGLFCKSSDMMLIKIFVK